MPSVELDESGHIIADLSCVGCSYNLRGLDAEAACPECGVAVGRSLRGDLLQFANPEWAERIARAMNVALAAIELGIIFGVVGLFLMQQLRNSSAFWFVVYVVIGAPALVGLVACWMFSAKEVNLVESELAVNWRLIARWSAVALVIFVAIEMHLVRFWGPSRQLWWFPEVVAVGVAVATIGVFAAGQYSVSLARRLPDEALAKRTRFVALGCTAIGLLATSGLCGLVIVFWLPDLPIFGWFPPGGIFVVAFAVPLLLGAALAVITFIGFSMATVDLMYRFRMALRNAARIARSTWASDLK